MTRKPGVTRKALLTLIMVILIICLLFMVMVIRAGCDDSGDGYSQDEMMDKAMDMQKKIPADDPFWGE